MRSRGLLSFAGKLCIEACEVEAGRDACALPLFDEPQQIVHDLLVSLMHFYHAHGLQSFHVSQCDAGHRVELSTLGLRLADMEHFA